MLMAGWLGLRCSGILTPDDISRTIPQTTSRTIDMIDLYYWPTPNGHKITIFLEEAGLDYKIVPVNIRKGEQFAPEFLKISPNNRMPAIVDQDGPGGKPLALFESGAILLYLAEKTGKFMPSGTRARYNLLQGLMFQMCRVGPIFGQRSPFMRA